MVMVPALALGATFPMAIRWFARGSAEPARESSRLYFVNTAGAAVGAMLAGFVLIPSIGMQRDDLRGDGGQRRSPRCACCRVCAASPPDKPPALTRHGLRVQRGRPRTSKRPWLAIAILGLSGFAALVHEIAWTRILSLVLGPTTYAFAATLAAVIAGVAIGSGIGAWLVSTRASKAAGMLAFTLSLAAVTASWTYAAAGSRIPMMVARYVADFADFDQLLLRGVLLTMALILPTSACLGAAFPFALALADDRLHPAPGRFGLVYAINTLGSVTGSLAAGFLFIPAFGIQPTLWIVSGCLIACTAVLIFSGALTGMSRAGRTGHRGRVDRPRRHQPAMGSRAAGIRRLHVCAVRAEGSRSRNAAESGRAALLRRGRGRHGVGEEADRDDDAGGRWEDGRLEPRRHADAEADRAPAAVAASAIRRTCSSSVLAAA